LVFPLPSCFRGGLAVFRPPSRFADDLMAATRRTASKKYRLGEMQAACRTLRESLRTREAPARREHH
jgi:hypothetical protein